MRGVRRRREMGVGVPKWGRVSLHILQKTGSRLLPPPAGGIAMRHRYTRAELESITQETTIYIEGAGIAQLRWGGLEIAEGVKDGCLYCKHIKLFSLELYGQYWTAFDGPPERKENA
mgnify:FL=1